MLFILLLLSEQNQQLLCERMKFVKATLKKKACTYENGKRCSGCDNILNKRIKEDNAF